MSMQDLEKWRMPIAMLLSFVVVVVWAVWQGNQLSEPEERPAPVGSSPDEQSVEKSALEPMVEAPESPGVREAGSWVRASEAETQGGGRKHILENERLRITIASATGTIESADLRLSKDKDWVRVDGADNPEDLVRGLYQTGELSFFPMEEAVRKGRPEGLFRVVAEAKDRIDLEGYLTLNVAGQARDLRVLKTFELVGYALRMTVGLASKEPLSGFYYVLNGSGLGFDDSQGNYLDVARLAYSTRRGSKLETVLDKGFFSMFSAPKLAVDVSSPSEWIALDDRFHMRLLKPKEAVHSSSFRRAEWADSLPTEALVGAYKVSFDLAKGEATSEFDYYFLPKSRALVNKFTREQGETFYNLFRQWSVLRVLSGWMYALLEWIQSWAQNYGVSIVLMTLGLKLAIAPLTIKGQRSMQRIQELNPKVNALRSQHKANPKRANKEIMDLYRREKANPMGGCLPLLLPLPIFFALYSLFQNMVELQGESFLWVKDLTEPDVLFSMPFALPFLGSGFHGLPFLMLVTQLVQSIFLTPKAAFAKQDAEKGSAQAMIRQQAFLMKYFMPVFFFFICWSMPSALVLFWTVQNIFSIGQSMLFVKRKT